MNNKSIALKTIGVFICFSFIFLFLSMRSGEPQGDKYDQTMHALTKMLEIQHYSPKVLDDNTSASIYSDYLNSMDPEKNIFINSDIDAFDKFKYQIDDEMKVENVDLFRAVLIKYKSRVLELQKEYETWFKNPFTFNNPKEIFLSKNKIHPANSSDRTKLWISKVKYMTLEKYVELKEARENSKIDSVKNRKDADLETEARASIKKVFKKIMEQYVSGNSDDEFFSMYANAAVNFFDPHSHYFLPVDKRSWNESLSGKFYGIGATIGEENGYLKLTTLAVGGPAWKSGEVEAGDLILKVAQGDDKPVDVAGYSINEGIKLIRGDDKTIVTLTLKRADGSIHVVKLQRAELKIEETFARSNILNYKNKKFGIINLPKFYTSFGDPTGRSCSADVSAELERLKSNNVDGVIMDLRSNGGGSLQEVIDMVGLFIPEGPVVQVKGKTGRPGVYFDRDSKTVYDGPLMVMVNEFSASASEIFAAAIQDYKRGMIVGSGTYGKGTVQRPYNLNKDITGTIDLGTAHITMQKYYRINGASVQLKGVQPDVRLNGYYESNKVKEKDEPTALPWDELGKLQFNYWNNPIDVPMMQKYLTEKIDTAQSFARFDENAKWLASLNEQPKSLSEELYKAELKNIRDKTSFNRKVMRLENDLDVYGIFDGDQNDKIKIDRNNRVTTFYKRDHYLEMTADMMHKWITSRPLTTSN